MTFFDDLKSRGLYYDSTAGAREHFESGQRRLYCGFDATASHLHIGSLIPLTAMAVAAKHGHEPVMLIGGATTRIGDPTGRTEARTVPTNSEIDFNTRNICDTFDALIGNAVAFNNLDWYLNREFVDVLMEIIEWGPTMNQVLSLKFIKERMKHGDMSMLETLYPYMQGYDFRMLHDIHGVTAQLGGQDQYGNITVGTHMAPPGTKFYGITTPLLTDAAGNKIGKTSGHDNTWLPPSVICDIKDAGGLETLDLDKIKGLIK